MQSTPTSKYGIKIATVDIANRTIQGILKTGGLANIQVISVPPAWRWPEVGEFWMARQENGTWYLESTWPDTTAAQSVFDANEGDVVITSPNGKIRVVGSPDGGTDFTLTKPIQTPPNAQLRFRGRLSTVHTHGHTHTIDL